MSMMAWLTETLHAFDLTWTALLWGLVSFLGMFIGSIAVVALLLVKLPATYFCDACPHDFWGDRHPMIRWTGLILKNLLGVLLGHSWRHHDVAGSPRSGHLDDLAWGHAAELSRQAPPGTVADTPSNGAERHEPAAAAVWEAAHGVRARRRKSHEA